MSMGRFERPFCLGGGAVVRTSHGALGDILLMDGATSSWNDSGVCSTNAPK